MDTMIGARALRRTIYIMSSDVITYSSFVEIILQLIVPIVKHRRDELVAETTNMRLFRVSTEAWERCCLNTITKQITVKKNELNEMWVHSPTLGAQGNFSRIEKHDTM